MYARALVWIWFHLYLSLNFIKSTSSLSPRQDVEYKSTEISNSAIPTESVEYLASTSPMKRAYIHEPAVITGRKRSYRQVEPEPSIGPTVLTENSPYERNDLTEKYNSLATTESLNSNKTVIPLTTTELYVSHTSSKLGEPSKTDTNVSITTTPTYNYLEDSDLTENATTNEATEISKANKVDEYIETTSKFRQDIESSTLSIQWLNPSGDTKTAERSDPLEVVGVPKVDNYTERYMILHPSKDDKYVRVKETVHDMLEDTMLIKETEDYVIQLNRRFKDLPIVDSDNLIWKKYSRAIVESFILDFCRNYPHYTTTEQSIARSYKVEEYNLIYNTTLLHLKQKKNQTAIQFGVPVRRAIDIYKAILDTPIGIVQSKCTVDMPQWLCFAKYVVHLADISKMCEHVWYHAQVHLTVLQSKRHAKGTKDPASEAIAELDLRLSELEPNNDVNFLFDVIIQTIADLDKRLKDLLLAQVSIYSLIRELQSEDKLKCLNIHDQGW